MNLTKIVEQKYAHLYSICLIIVSLNLSGCSLIREDVGPYHNDEQTYGLANFNRLDMGSAFILKIQQGTTFSVIAEGDRRNLDDLEVYTRNGTLKAQYRVARNRQYSTTFRVTMPTLRGVDFSGSSRSTITGFTTLSDLDINLSGASECQFIGQSTRTTIDLSGASSLQISGQGTWLSAELSGASVLQAFGYPVENAGLGASGASKASVYVNAALVAEASGASKVRYRGTPAVAQKVSGSSTVQRED